MFADRCLKASDLSPIYIGMQSNMTLGGPPAVPGATRFSTLALSLTYNPDLVRVRSMQQGIFMRQGGATPAFTSQSDERSGRVDIVITRPGDQTGASSAGLLAALLLEPPQFLPAGTTVR